MIDRRPLLLALLVAACAPADAERPASGAAVFISPMGEPFRAARSHRGNLIAWFDGADADHDGHLTLAEFRADAMPFFATLDTDGDGEIAPLEIDRYERMVAPEVRVREERASPAEALRRNSTDGQGGFHFGDGGSRTPQRYVAGGAARYGLLALPEPVVAADLDQNRGVSRAEFATAAGQRFVVLDANHDGLLTVAELTRVRTR